MLARMNDASIRLVGMLMLIVDMWVLVNNSALMLVFVLVLVFVRVIVNDTARMVVFMTVFRFALHYVSFGVSDLPMQQGRSLGWQL